MLPSMSCSEPCDDILCQVDPAEHDRKKAKKETCATAVIDTPIKKENFLAGVSCLSSLSRFCVHNDDNFNKKHTSYHYMYCTTIPCIFNVVKRNHHPLYIP